MNHKVPPTTQRSVSHNLYSSHGGTDGRKLILYVCERAFMKERKKEKKKSVSGDITSSKTSASLLSTSSGSDWNEGTLGAGGESKGR